MEVMAVIRNQWKHNIAYETLKRILTKGKGLDTEWFRPKDTHNLFSLKHTHTRTQAHITNDKIK